VSQWGETVQDNSIRKGQIMTKNIGTADKTIRIIVALIFAWLYYSGRIVGTLGIVLLVIAIMFVVTSLISWCPAYIPFKFSTRKNPSA
jgi:hypothetical protein